MKKSILLLTLVAGLLGSSLVQAQQKNIVETAVGAGNFDTLVAAVKAAGLVETLGGQQQLTVFAPTDEAFAKIDQAQLQALLKPENREQLTDILTYHVVPGRVQAKDAFDLNNAKTVNGQRLPLNFRGDSLRVGNAGIKVTDIPCSNGVIHVIDTVLMPELQNIPATAQAAGKFNTLLAAVDKAGLGDALSADGPLTVFAPTDEAFDALPDGTVETLLKPENRQKLVDILKFHVVAGRLYDSDLVQAGQAPTLLGRSVNVNFSADGISVNDAKVVGRNIDTSNGVIHVIDSVLLPKAMSRTDAMSFLNSAINEGVPVFNAGHHGRCCEIYMNAMQQLMSTGIASTDDHTMSLVTETLDRAQSTHDMTDRAWVLRRGIDSVYTRLSDRNR